jgi:tryptophan aminotransferase
MTASLERRKEVLRIARAHNIIILEDDPYYYLYFGARSRPASFFALEVQLGGTVGNVLRFDSFSKILSAGIRLGMVSGPEPIIRAIDMHTMTSNLQVSSLTQAIIHALLTSWGYDGFKRHTECVSELYRAKRDVFENAMKKHLGDLADWVTPEAGMFYW